MLLLIPKLYLFYRKRIFAIITYIFAYNSRTTKYFQNLKTSCKRTDEQLSESQKFYLKINFIRYKIYFLGQIYRFLPHFSENRARAGLIWFIQAVEAQISGLYKKKNFFCSMGHKS